MSLWEIEIFSAPQEVDREGARVASACRALGLRSVREVRAAKSYLLQGALAEKDVEVRAASLLVDSIVEVPVVRQMSNGEAKTSDQARGTLLNVLYKPGVTDNAAASTRTALLDLGLSLEAAATCPKSWFNADA